MKKILCIICAAIVTAFICCANEVYARDSADILDDLRRGPGSAEQAYNNLKNSPGNAASVYQNFQRPDEIAWQNVTRNDTNAGDVCRRITGPCLPVGLAMVIVAEPPNSTKRESPRFELWDVWTTERKETEAREGEKKDPQVTLKATVSLPPPLAASIFNATKSPATTFNDFRSW